MSTEKNTQRYFGMFNSIEDVRREFGVPDDDVTFPDDSQVLFATYDREDYSGSALVVFTEGGALYEVNGFHCSCNGLEGNWRPEETSWAALKIRTIRAAGDAIEAFARLVEQNQ